MTTTPTSAANATGAASLHTLTILRELQKLVYEHLPRSITFQWNWSNGWSCGFQVKAFDENTSIASGLYARLRLHAEYLKSRKKQGLYITINTGFSHPTLYRPLLPVPIEAEIVEGQLRAAAVFIHACNVPIIFKSHSWPE